MQTASITFWGFIDGAVILCNFRRLRAPVSTNGARVAATYMSVGSGVLTDVACGDEGFIVVLLGGETPSL